MFEMSMEDGDVNEVIDYDCPYRLIIDMVMRMRTKSLKLDAYIICGRGRRIVPAQ